MQIQLANHSYEILIQKGALQEVGQWVSQQWSKQKIAIITDTNVAPLYAEQVSQNLVEQGFQVSIYIVPAGEQSKSLQEAEKLYQALADDQFSRSDGVIALGGGVIGDLAGFVASTFMRGLHFLQIPTTLLAQVDSSIGGKTAVNTTAAKNLVGTFAQPDGVLIDPEVLKTLDERRIREGIAEIIKAGAIADIKLWNLLQTLKDEYELIEQAGLIIPLALQVKKRVVEEDVFDKGSRLTLNFGHTIGHGIENTAGYGVISHGEAVAIGMVMISQEAEKQQLMPKGITQEICQMLERFHLPTQLGTVNPVAVYQAITHDKKTRGSNIKVILLEKIGQAKIVTLPVEEIKKYIY